MGKEEVGQRLARVDAQTPVFVVRGFKVTGSVLTWWKILKGKAESETIRTNVELALPSTFCALRQSSLTGDFK